MATHSPLLITGMHRSGTSLVARLLRGAGVEMGERLLGADASNPYGHFEDVAFLDLHRRILRRANCPMLAVDGDPVPELNEEERQAAKQLVRTRRDCELWGFKDPRTSLLLESWDQLLPGAGFVFVYRSPVEVALSLWNRGTDVEVLACPERGIHSWRLHNGRILDFSEQLRSRAVLANVHTIVADPSAFVDRVAERLGLSLRSTGLTDLVDDSALSRSPSSAQLDLLMQETWPRAMDLYHRLEEVADLPSGRPADSPQRPVEGGVVDEAFTRALGVVRALHARIGRIDLTERAALLLMTEILAPEAGDPGRRLWSKSKQAEERADHFENRIRELELHTGNLEREVEERDRQIRELHRHVNNLEQLLEGVGVKESGSS